MEHHLALLMRQSSATQMSSVQVQLELINHLYYNITPPVDCEVGDWGAWGLCSQSCGGGLQGRGRDVTVDQNHGGAVCPVLKETRYCIIQDCPEGRVLISNMYYAFCLWQMVNSSLRYYGEQV